MFKNNRGKNFIPGYIELLESGELDNRIKILKERLKECIICPHHCQVDRFAAVKYAEELGITNIIKY